MVSGFRPARSLPGVWSVVDDVLEVPFVLREADRAVELLFDRLNRGAAHERRAEAPQLGKERIGKTSADTNRVAFDK